MSGAIGVRIDRLESGSDGILEIICRRHAPATALEIVGNYFSVETPLRNAADERYHFSRFVAASKQIRFDSDCWPRGLDPIKADDATVKLVSVFINASRLENGSSVSSVEPRKCDLVPFSLSRRFSSLARGSDKIVRLSATANELSDKQSNKPQLHRGNCRSVRRSSERFILRTQTVSPRLDYVCS